MNSKKSATAVLWGLMPPKALILDLDGTLIDSLPDIVRSVNELRREYGLSTITRGTVLGGIGRGAEHLIQTCLPSRPTSAALLKDVARYQFLYSSGKSRSRAFVHVRKGLIRLTKTLPKMRLAVVTNKPTRLAKESLKWHLSEFHFEQVRGPETVSQRKPDPAHLMETLTALRLDPSEILYVGDDSIDAQLARACSCAFAGAEWGYGKLRESEADQPLFATFEAIVDIILAKVPTPKSD